MAIVAEQPPRSAPRPEGLQSVGRALAALDVLAHNPEGVTAKAIAAELGLKLGTTYHLLNTLLAAGYASQDPVGRLVRLGPRIPQLYEVYAEAVRASPRLLPFVHALQQATGETATLWSWWGADIVATAVVEGFRPERIPGGLVGFTCVPHAIAAGRVLLAWADEEYREAGLGRTDVLGRPWPAPPAPDALRAILDRIRLVGYAIDRGNVHPEVCCVAAPIFDEGGETAQALAVMVPRRRFTREESVLVDAVLGIAQAARAGLRASDAPRQALEPDDPEFQAEVDAALGAARTAVSPLPIADR